MKLFLTFEIFALKFNNTIVRDVRPGKIYAQCYPVAVGTEEGMYTVAGTFTENEKNYLALNAIEKAEAGEPYIYIYGETTDYAEPAEGEEAVTEEVEFTFGNEVVSEAKTVNGLVGTFAYQWVDKGTPVFVNNGVEGATESLISTMAAFEGEMNGMSNTDFAMSIIDKFNEIGNNFAISSGGIGEALERSASSLMAANNTIDESIALITAANTVVQDPEAVGKWLADIKSGYIG